MQRGINVAMQIEHKVRVATELLNFHAQRAQLVERTQLVQAFNCRLADGAHIGVGVRSQLAAHALGHGVAQVDPVAVEVFVAQQVVAACVRIAHQLRLTNRIDRGHQNDLALNQPFFVGFGQHGHEVVHGHGAGHFVGVDGRLHVDLGPCADFSKAQNRNAALAAGRHAGQCDGTFFDGHAVSCLIVEPVSKA
jgi:hypothetical protein